jgi:hypothetical protein
MLDSFHECRSCFKKTLTIELSDAFPKHPPARQANRNHMSFSIPIPNIPRKARKAGSFAEANGAEFLKNPRQARLQVGLQIRRQHGLPMRNPALPFS